MIKYTKQYCLDPKNKVVIKVTSLSEYEALHDYFERDEKKRCSYEKDCCYRINDNNYTYDYELYYLNNDYDIITLKELFKDRDESYFKVGDNVKIYNETGFGDCVFGKIYLVDNLGCDGLLGLNGIKLSKEHGGGYNYHNPEGFVKVNKKITGYKLIKEYPGSKKLGYIEPFTTGEFSSFPEFWEPVYEQTKKVYIIDHTNGNFMVEITPKLNIKFEGKELNVKQLSGIVEYKGEFDGWAFRHNTVDIGCKKGIKVSDIREILQIYNGK